MRIDPKTEIGKALWEYMQRHPMTIQTTAKTIGLAWPTVHRVLTADKEPRVLIRLTIEKFLKQENDQKEV